jgi:hypothetical protein
MPEERVVGIRARYEDGLPDQVSTDSQFGRG